MRKYRKFPKSKRSTFPYWFWHWLAFNDVAREWGVWELHHLFHDIEKPFLRLILPYKIVQRLHRTHSAHHLEYKHAWRRNWKDMVIDWEASGRTKEACPYNAIQEANNKFDNGEMTWHEYELFVRTWNIIANKR